MAGSLTAIVSAVGIAKLFGASHQTLASLAPKSVTTPIAMAVAEKVGGIPSLTTVLVMSTGVFGAVSARWILDVARVRETEVRGFAIGVASHGIGTPRAFQVSEEMGAFSGLGIGHLEVLWPARSLSRLVTSPGASRSVAYRSQSWRPLGARTTSASGWAGSYWT